MRGHHLTADPEHFLTVLEHRPEAVRPHVVLLERWGEPVALAIGRIEDTKLAARIGYRKIAAPRVRALTLVYGGYLGDASESTARRMFDELRAAAGARRGRRPSPPPARARFAASPARVHGPARTPARAQRAGERALAARRRQLFRRAAPPPLGERAAERSLLRNAPADRVRRPVEARRLQGRLGSRASLPRHRPRRDQRVGTYVLCRTLEDACADPGVAVVDYGFGDAEYKRHFGDRSWTEPDVLVYARTARGLRSNLVRMSVGGAAGIARRALRDASGVARMKRRWRDRLRPAQS